MTGMLKRLLIALAVLGLVTTASATTTTTSTSTSSTTTSSTIEVSWAVVTNNDCTGAQLPVWCCTGSHQGRCAHHMAVGDLFLTLAQLTAGAGMVYHSNGDLISATQFAKLGLSSVVATFCDSDSAGYTPVVLTPSTANNSLGVELFASGGTEASNNTLVAGQTFSCQIYGY